MAIRYNADEIFQIGVEIEKNGKAFYKAAAEVSDNEVAKKLFEELADWESGHIALFEDLRAKLTEGVPDMDLEAEEQAHLYLKAAADSHVFGCNADPVALANECPDPRAVLERAITFEKDSVVVYSTMRNIVPDALGKNEVDKLIGEELEHIFILTDKLELVS